MISFRKAVIHCDKEGVFPVRNWYMFLSCLYISQVSCFRFCLALIVQWEWIHLFRVDINLCMLGACFHCLKS